MKKKILYGIFFISIFLLSTASMVTPVRGYDFGVPDAAVGVTAESEIKIYDKDEWKDHLGSDVGTDELFVGDTDEVGAKSKSVYLEIEKRYDDKGIKYVGDYVWEGDIKDGNDLSRQTVASLYNPLVSGDYGPLMYFYNACAWLSLNPTAFGLPVVLSGANQSVAYELATTINGSILDPIAGVAANPILSYEDAAGYNKKYDGYYLHRDYWEYTDKAYKAKPDDKDYEIPFLADPYDWLSAWEYTNLFKENQIMDVYTLLGIWGQNWQYAGGANPTGGMFGHGPGGSMSQADVEVYEYLNTTIIPTFINVLVILGEMTAKQGADLLDAIDIPNDLSALEVVYPGWNGGDYYTDRVYGMWGTPMKILQIMAESIDFGYPSKPGFLLSTLCAGLPVYVPQDDFTAKIVKIFNIRDDILYKVPFVSREFEDAEGIPVFIPVYAYFDISAENGIVTVGIEYKDGIRYDPSDLFNGEADPNELDDFEVTFAYGDTGGQGTVQVKDGDTVFWEAGAVQGIPGFEITIILGASALSILALIYVVMKKRKM
ncbi:MAG: hypothetical protein ACFFHV_03970 [Promethearchaeota archaeon]